MPNNDRSKRLFFGIWPDEGALRDIQKCLKHWPVKQGRPVRPANIHLTLAFIGNADIIYQQCLQKLAGQVKLPAFRIRLDQQGYFEKARVVWLGPSVCAPLTELASQLNQSLQTCGYCPEARPYKPHITLYRKALLTEKPLLFKPIEWYVECFYLAESRNSQAGVHYEKLKRYELEKD